MSEDEYRQFKRRLTGDPEATKITTQQISKITKCRKSGEKPSEEKCSGCEAYNECPIVDAAARGRKEQ